MSPRSPERRRLKRARVRLEAEKVLLGCGEASVAELTYILDQRLKWAMNKSEVGIYLRHHPRIERRKERNIVIYCIHNLDSEASGG